MSLFASLKLHLLRTFFSSPPRDFVQPSNLDSRRVEPRWYLLVALVLFALAPRVWMATRLDTFCFDGYYYIHMADQIERGDLEHAFTHLSLNVYPAVLAVLHKLGLEWSFAAKFWGTLVSTLTVLPLFGWVRRLFDDRVAAVSCFLFAIHPELIELSPESIREPTFWFFFNLAIYQSWRAATEPRVWRFALLGVTTTLAINTRTEGWLLLIPMLLWVLRSATANKSQRRWILAGTAACLGVMPLLLLLVNVTALRNFDRWEWGRFGLFGMGYNWVTSHLGLNPEAVDAAREGLFPWTAAELQWYVQHFAKKLLMTFEPQMCVIMLLGLVGWRHLGLRGRQFPLLLVAGLCFAMNWVLLLIREAMNGRYLLPIFFLLVPFAALGLIWVLNRISTFRWRSLLAGRGVYVAGLILVVFSVVCWGDAVGSSFRGRVKQEALGCWLRAEYGPLDRVLADSKGARVAYCALDTCPDVFYYEIGYDITQDVAIVAGERLRAAWLEEQPQVVVLTRMYYDVVPPGEVEDFASKMKMVQLDLDSTPHSGQPFLVFVQKDIAEARLARQAATATAGLPAETNAR